MHLEKVCWSVIPMFCFFWTWFPNFRSTVGDVVELVSDDQIPGFCHFVLASASCRCLKSNQYSVLPSFLPFFCGGLRKWTWVKICHNQHAFRQTLVEPQINPPHIWPTFRSRPWRPWQGKCLYRLQTDAASPGDFLGSQTWARGDRSSITLEAGL